MRVTIPPLISLFAFAGLGGIATLALAQPAAPDSFIAVRAPVVALTHVRVIDGLGHPPLEDQTLLLRDGKIAALGAAGSVAVPAGASVLDLAGKSVIPGLVMVHEHLFYSAITKGPFHLNEMEYSFPRLYLAAGVTSARTTGSIEPYTDLHVKAAIDAGQSVGPKLHLTAPYLDGDGTNVTQLHVARTTAEAVRMVNYWADEGFTSVKAYVNLPPDMLAATVKAAHARGLQVTGHIGRTTYREAAEAGIDNLEHGFLAMSDFNPKRQPGSPVSAGAAANYRGLESIEPDSPPFSDLLQLLVSRRVALTSTLAIFETFTPGRPMAPDAALEALAPPLRESYVATWTGVGNRNDPLAKAIFAKNMPFEEKFFRAGGLLAVGTDPTGYGGCIAGYGSWRAIELLVEAGLTPLEALQVATSNGAKLLHIDAQTGSIQIGKAADLVIIAGDPSRNISDIRHAETVFKDGIGYDSAKLFAAVKGLVGIQ